MIALVLLILVVNVTLNDGCAPSQFVPRYGYYCKYETCQLVKIAHKIPTHQLAITKVTSTQDMKDIKEIKVTNETRKTNANTEIKVTNETRKTNANTEIKDANMMQQQQLLILEICMAILLSLVFT
jgi:hypothetical protein